MQKISKRERKVEVGKRCGTLKDKEGGGEGLAKRCKRKGRGMKRKIIIRRGKYLS